MKFFRLTSEYVPRYYSLYERVFGSVPSEDFLQTKSWGWHTPGEFLVLGALSSEKELIGAISFFPRNFVFDDHRIRCVEAGDVMVCPLHRGLSVFLRLIQYSFPELQRMGIPLVYGFPNSNAVPGWRKAGTSFSFQAERAVLFNPGIGSLLAQKIGLQSHKPVKWLDDFGVFLQRDRRYSVCVSADIAPALVSFHNKTSFPYLLEREKAPEYTLGGAIHGAAVKNTAVFYYEKPAGIWHIHCQAHQRKFCGNL